MVGELLADCFVDAHTAFEHASSSTLFENEDRTEACE